MDGFKKIVKMKTGGLVKTPVTGDKKADAPSKAAAKPAFAGSDVAKEKSKPAGHKDPYIKSKESGKTPDAPSAAVKGRKAKAEGTVSKFKCGGNVKKMQTGGSSGALIGGALGGGLAGMAQDQERKKRIAQYLSPTQQAQLAQQQATATAAQPPVPNPMPQAPGGVSPAGAIPMQKRGGKVKKMNTGGTCP